MNRARLHKLLNDISSTSVCDFEERAGYALIRVRATRDDALGELLEALALVRPLGVAWRIQINGLSPVEVP